VHCPRAQYFGDFPFDLKKMRFSNGKPTLGIHINGSPYSIATQKKFGMVPKNIPVKVIKELISDAYNIMIFGSHEEVKGMGIDEDDNLKHICYPDIAESLAYVQQCNAVVASDSAIKTMSAMNHIPTFVWLGDYPDGPRDQMFIDPYVNDGVMQVFRYKDVHTQFDEGIEKTKAFIKEVL
jgi:ADP-heptose:LPS heptosyltransferase